MKNFRILSEINSGVWLINPEYARQQMPLIKNLLKGKVKGQQRELPPLSTFAGGNHTTVKDGFASSEIQQGSIAIINISGPITKHGGWCSYGTKHFSSWLAQAEANPNIAGILFKFDTPGGTIGGTGSFAEQIHSCTKPTLGFIDDGMCCSAGLWMISPCDKIISSHPTNSVGSIGVYVSLWKKIKSDYDSYEILEIYADQSSEKNKPYKEALAGKTKTIKEELLNPLAQNFIDSVKLYRGDKLDTTDKKLFQGKVYLSEEGKKRGLIDEIGNFDFALQTMQNMIAEQGTATTENSNFNSNTKTNNLMNIKASWTALLGFLGFSISAAQDEAPQLTDQHLESLNAELAAREEKLLKAEKENERLLLEKAKEKEKLEEEKTQLEQKVTQLTTQRDEWQQKAEEYGAKADGKTSNPKRETDSEPATEEKPLAPDMAWAVAEEKKMYGEL